jgi:hypothetical protein
MTLTDLLINVSTQPPHPPLLQGPLNDMSTGFSQQDHGLVTQAHLLSDLPALRSSGQQCSQLLPVDQVAVRGGLQQATIAGSVACILMRSNGRVHADSMHVSCMFGDRQAPWLVESPALAPGVRTSVNPLQCI